MNPYFNIVPINSVIITDSDVPYYSTHMNELPKEFYWEMAVSEKPLDICTWFFGKVRANYVVNDKIMAVLLLDGTILDSEFFENNNMSDYMHDMQSMLVHCKWNGN